MKNVNVLLTVSYDKIRQTMCVLTGQVLTDQQIDELVGEEVLSLESHVFDESKEEIDTILSAMILAQKFKEKEDLEAKPKSKFEERLEAMQAQRKKV
jgi:hypothetical protein